MAHQLVTDGQYLAVFNSTHRVLKAESVLKGQLLPIMLIPAPRAVQADCGLAIRFDSDQLGPVMQVLRTEQLLPSFLCRLTGDQFQIIEEFAHEDR